MSDELKTIEESAKAAQEIAKTTGSAIGAIENFGQFIARFINGPLEQGVGIVEDKLKYMRWERQVRLMQRAEELMHEIGLEAPSRPVPMKFAVPLLQAASLEENDSLQDRWATLLVNAANASSEVELKRVYIDILERISAVEARILETVYSIPYEQMQHAAVLTKDLPEQAFIVPDDSTLAHEEPSNEIVLALANLDRLGCLSVSHSLGGGELFSSVNPTLLSKKFVEACTLQRK